MADTSNLPEMLIQLTGDIVGAHVSNNSVAVADVPVLIANVYAALNGLGQPKEEERPRQEPAVSIRASVRQDYIVCLEDGKKLKMLKRHLATRYSMTPDDYRAKWGLPADYPMVAPAYAEQRRELAKTIGLGRTPRVKGARSAAAPKKAAVARRPRKKASDPAQPE